MENKTMEEILCEKFLKEESYYIDKEYGDTYKLVIDSHVVTRVLLALITLKTDLNISSVEIQSCDFKEKRKKALENKESEED